MRSNRRRSKSNAASAPRSRSPFFRAIRRPAWKRGVLYIYEIRGDHEPWLVFQPTYNDGSSTRSRLRDYPANWYELAEAELLVLETRATPAHTGSSRIKTTRDGAPPGERELQTLREELAAARAALSQAFTENMKFAAQARSANQQLAARNAEIHSRLTREPSFRPK